MMKSRKSAYSLPIIFAAFCAGMLASAAESVPTLIQPDPLISPKMELGQLELTGLPDYEAGYELEPQIRVLSHGGQAELSLEVCAELDCEDLTATVPIWNGRRSW
jgi:hypothetical protein